MLHVKVSQCCPSAEGSVETDATVETESQAGTETGSVASFDADLAAAQRAQREALLVGQNSLNDSRKRLQEVREAMEQREQTQAGKYSHSVSCSHSTACWAGSEEPARYI